MQATKEFCGKCIAVPLVKLALETYSPPDFPPKLQWYEFQPRKDCTGSILAAFELIEVSLYRFFSRQILYIYPLLSPLSLFSFFVAIYFIHIWCVVLFFNLLREHVMSTRIYPSKCTRVLLHRRKTRRFWTFHWIRQRKIRFTASHRISDRKWQATGSRWSFGVFATWGR